MKTLREQIDGLRAKGYSAVLASAKVVHDVVLLAIGRSGFRLPLEKQSRGSNA